MRMSVEDQSLLYFICHPSLDLYLRSSHYPLSGHDWVIIMEWNVLLSWTETELSTLLELFKFIRITYTG